MASRTLATAFLLSVSLLFGWLAAPVAAKRPAPKAVKPVSAKGVEYRVAHERFSRDGTPAGLRAFVEAWDQKAKKKLWRVQVYQVAYDPKLEADVQDVYVTSLSFRAKGLLVKADNKKQYLIDLAKKTVSEVK
jgi:hypothetical protein